MSDPELDELLELARLFDHVDGKVKPHSLDPQQLFRLQVGTLRVVHELREMRKGGS